ncbi:MAG: PHP domain-containing protein [Clostridia bacterium]|nr:PHP domain-containing protein [Clostridia bacterium]
MVDLHSHSVFSDGTYTPAELIREAEAIGLTALTLCDHNTAKGLPDFFAAAKGKRVTPIPAAELSAEFEGSLIHIIAMFLPESQYDTIDSYMEDSSREDQIAVQKMIEHLGTVGYPLDLNSIPRNALGRIAFPNIAVAMAEAGYGADRYEARKLLSALWKEAKPLMPKVPLPNGVETVRFIRSIGAVPVLAHPYLNLTEEQLPRFLKEAVAAGLQGMEVYYYSFDEATTAKAEILAKRFGLLPSGGSDFHGAARPASRLGVGKGNLQIPDSVLFQLKEGSACHG